MAEVRATRRPGVERFVRWDGANLSEVEDFVGAANVQDNQDGTISVLNSSAIWTVAERGDYVRSDLEVFFAQNVQQDYQAVKTNSLDQAEYELKS